MSHFRGSLHDAVGYLLSPAPRADFINELLTQDTSSIRQRVLCKAGSWVFRTDLRESEF
jgi:hypothetical protein